MNQASLISDASYVIGVIMNFGRGMENVSVPVFIPDPHKSGTLCPS